MLLKMFDQHYGVCDGLDDGKPFYGDEACPLGSGFYPHDMTKNEFEAWLTANPQDEANFRNGYTVIRRDGDKLVAIPYHKYYAEWVEPAAQIMRDAAELSEEPSLKRFLNMRADAFLSDDYFESEMAWMDLEGNIEVAVGPYEVYDDQLYGYKTAYEMFLTIKNPDESAALAKYKDFLKDMEANLPVEEEYKNFKRGFESPIAVTYQVKGGGDNVPGVQTIAFNLPNDERVREAKGAKKVILNNVLGAKYDRILSPIGERVLVDTKAGVFVKPHQRRAGYVFQDARLFPHLNVARNLAYGQPKVGGPDLSEVLKALGIGHLFERFPRDLSGGEAQRVAIGRALMSAPELLLMDEPLASLDQARRGEILPYLDRVRALSGVQIFYVSHAMSEVARLADQIVLLRAGQVVKAGSTGDILSDPDLVPEIGLGEAGAVLTARLAEPNAGDGLSRLETSAGELYLPQIKAEAGSAVRVRILASDIIVSRDRPTGLSALNILPAQITGLRQGTGPGMAVALQSGEDRLVARITRRSAFALGLAVGGRCYAVIKSVSVAPGSVSAG